MFDAAQWISASSQWICARTIIFKFKVKMSYHYYVNSINVLCDCDWQVSIFILYEMQVILDT